MQGYNFTEGVRKALGHARLEAERLGHEAVGTEHMLLGLLRTPGGVATAAIENLGASAASLTRDVEQCVAPGPPGLTPDPNLPFTSRAKKALELSMTAARDLHDSFVGREHLLLGLLAEKKGYAAQVLIKSGITFDAAVREIQHIRGVVQPEGAPSAPGILTAEREDADADGLAVRRPRSDVNLLRHTLSTLAYRGAKALRGAPPDFATFRVGPDSRTPAEILAHLGDLLDWSCSIAKGEERWHAVPSGAWDEDVARFHAGLERLDALLADGGTLHESPERLFQGAIADALTHVGQLTMLRRLAGAPIRGENYSKADIQRGRLDSNQTPPAMEFG